MKRPWFRYLIIIGVAVALLIVRRWNASPAPSTHTQKQQIPQQVPEAGGAEVNRNHGFDRRTAFIEYTKHAKCRMGCRHISQAEVGQIMTEGSINYNKSDVDAKPCPEYAVEGSTDDGQRVRIVFAQCDKKTKVVTVIDLGQDWSCDCPGDEKKSHR